MSNSNSNITIAQALVNIEDAIRNGSGGGELGTSMNTLTHTAEGRSLSYMLVMPDKTTIVMSSVLAIGSGTLVNDSLYVALISLFSLAVYDEDNEQVIEDVSADGTLTYEGTTYNLYKMVPFDESHPGYIAAIQSNVG